MMMMTKKRQERGYVEEMRGRDERETERRMMMSMAKGGVGERREDGCLGRMERMDRMDGWMTHSTE